MQLHATWCSLVQLAADQCNLLQFGAYWSIGYQVDAGDAKEEYDQHKLNTLKGLHQVVPLSTKLHHSAPS